MRTYLPPTAILAVAAMVGVATAAEEDTGSLHAAFNLVDAPTAVPSDWPTDINQVTGADSELAGGVSLTGCCEPSCGACEGCGEEVGCGSVCGGCGCSSGAKKGAGKPTCAGSHKGLYYRNNFSYLNDPCYRGNCLGDCFKQLDVGPTVMDIGGQVRLRQHSEQGMGHPGQLGFQDTDEDFLLTRVRLFSNVKMTDNVSFHIEGIFADAANDADYVPRPIDENFGDFLNVFFDAKLTDTLSLQVGRRELLYGAQRHISPLDWANTRRTFEGVTLAYKGDEWVADLFYTNFVPVDPNDLDEGDWNRRFYGAYATRAGDGNTSYDLFYIGFEDDRALGTNAAGSRDFSIHTFGGRAYGGQGKWLWDMESAFQVGRQSGLGQDHRAGMCTVGMGRKLDMNWSPTIWMYYDWASGDDTGGDFTRYNQLFPLAHKYLGFADFVARSNVSSPNCLITMSPSKKWKLLLWYYYLGADLASDIVPGVATNTVPLQNRTSDDWGHELDIIVRYQIQPRSNILVGYSNVWAGDKIDNALSDANFFYTQWELDF